MGSFIILKRVNCAFETTLGATIGGNTTITGNTKHNK